MKRNTTLLLSGVLLGCLLAGCANQEAAATQIIPAALPTVQTEPAETADPSTTVPTTTIPEAPAVPAVVARLEETKAQAAALEDKLMNDPSLTQADMNVLAGQQYTLWDNLLNALWAELTHTLPQERMEQLLQEQRAWIRWKENSIAWVADFYSGGSLSILVASHRAAQLTRDRVYELAELLTGYDFTPAQAGTNLYHQVFLPLVSLQQRPSFENLQLLLDFRGFTLLEEEGTFHIPDPQMPGSYLFGSLSNESDALTVPNMEYVLEGGSSRKGVRVDFFTESTDLYMDAVSWDDGVPASSPEELTSYLFAD